MFRLLRSLFKKEPPPWRIKVNRGIIVAQDPSGNQQQISYDDITAIRIETNDLGPLENDIWWILSDANGEALRFPQGIVGDNTVIDELKNFKGFNFTEMTKAMVSTENATFSIWQKEEVPSP